MGLRVRTREGSSCPTFDEVERCFCQTTTRTTTTSTSTTDTKSTTATTTSRSRTTPTTTTRTSTTSTATAKAKQAATTVMQTLQNLNNPSTITTRRQIATTSTMSTSTPRILAPANAFSNHIADQELSRAATGLMSGILWAASLVSFSASGSA